MISCLKQKLKAESPGRVLKGGFSEIAVHVMIKTYKLVQKKFERLLGLMQRLAVNWHNGSLMTVQCQIMLLGYSSN